VEKLVQGKGFEHQNTCKNESFLLLALKELDGRDLSVGLPVILLLF
jgi:hypothetical protein